MTPRLTNSRSVVSRAIGPQKPACCFPSRAGSHRGVHLHRDKTTRAVTLKPQAMTTRRIWNPLG
jgi:hypothetical protein